MEFLSKTTQNVEEYGETYKYKGGSVYKGLEVTQEIFEKMHMVKV